MSSLLEGIDVAESGGSKKSAGGPNPKVIKGAVAGVLLLLAGALLAMNFGIIPSFWGGGAPTNRQGEVVEYKPASDEEIRQITERLKAEEEEFIRRGGSIGGS